MTTTTESRNFTFLQVLRIKNTELWESKLNHYAMFHKNDLQVFYSKPLDTIILRVGEHQWILEKDLQIIGTRSKLGGWQCYCLPNPGGFYLLKIVDQQFEGELHPELVNLETILSSRSNFKRIDALEGQFNFFHEKQTASGFEALKENLVKAVEKIEEKFAHHEGADYANNKIVRPLNELLAVDTTGVPMADFNEHELTGLRGDMELIIRDHQNVGTFKEFFEGHTTTLGAEFESISIGTGQQLIGTGSQGQQNFGTGSENQEGLGSGFKGLQNAEGRIEEQNVGSNLQGQQSLRTGSENQEGLGSGFKGLQDVEGRIEDKQNLQSQQNLGTKIEGLKSPGSGLLNEEKLRSGSNLGESGSQEFTEAPEGRFHHDQQEVLGSDLQRLPAYEVHKTSQEVHKGFKEASANLGEDNNQPAGSNKEEDTEFTTGLMKNDVEGIQPSPKTPYHKNEELNPPVELKPDSDLTKRVDLPRESLDMAKESWGSNVTNPSETNPSLDTEFSKSGSKFNTSIRPGGDTRVSEEKIAEGSEKINEKETAGAI